MLNKVKIWIISAAAAVAACWIFFIYGKQIGKTNEQKEQAERNSKALGKAIRDRNRIDAHLDELHDPMEN